MIFVWTLLLLLAVSVKADIFTELAEKYILDERALRVVTISYENNHCMRPNAGVRESVARFIAFSDAGWMAEAYKDILLSGSSDLRVERDPRCVEYSTVDDGTFFSALYANRPQGIVK